MVKIILDNVRFREINSTFKITVFLEWESQKWVSMFLTHLVQNFLRVILRLSIFFLLETFFQKKIRFSIKSSRFYRGWWSQFRPGSSSDSVWRAKPQIIWSKFKLNFKVIVWIWNWPWILTGYLRAITWLPTLIQRNLEILRFAHYVIICIVSKKAISCASHPSSRLTLILALFLTNQSVRMSDEHIPLSNFA